MPAGRRVYRLALSLHPITFSGGLPPADAPHHCHVLPAGIDPIPAPDTKQEAKMLCLLLDAGLYPTCGDATCGNVKCGDVTGGDVTGGDMTGGDMTGGGTRLPGAQTDAGRE